MNPRPRVLPVYRSMGNTGAHATGARRSEELETSQSDFSMSARREETQRDIHDKV